MVETEAEAEAEASTLQIMRLAVASEAGAGILQDEPVVATQNNKSKSEILARHFGTSEMQAQDSA